ncbi:hypothetical protein V2J09_010827 [Rumex salicifolius]
MAYSKSRSVRFIDDVEVGKSGSEPERDSSVTIKQLKYKIQDESVKPDSCEQPVKSFRAKVLSRVFSEDYDRVKRKILDPRGHGIRKWNKVFLIACIVSLFVDPLFFFLPDVKHDDVCIEIGLPIEVLLTLIRSATDVFYILQIYVRFRTAYIAPSSRVFGRGELVVDPSKIASRYTRKGLWIDLVAALPLPQILIWGVIPSLSGSTMMNTKNVLRFMLIFQYFPRLFLIIPLLSQIIKANGVVTETAWAGAAYNLMLFILASHVLGACWYLLSVERQEACWRHNCSLEPDCQYEFFDCRKTWLSSSRGSWLNTSNLVNSCDPHKSKYPFGIYGEALTSKVTSSPVFEKYFYCLWWGLKNLSSLGQGLSTSTYVGEIAFAILIATLGLVLFALLIGNMQTYLQSTTVRLEEWRIRRTDTEQWMHHRQLPQELRQSVRRYDQYKWMTTHGVPLFDQMDERTLDAICERLKLALSTEGTYLVREGDPVNEMLFIIRGHLDSYTTNGGRTGFFNSCGIGPGDFCGEELLTWALDPRPGVILPSSTRTVKAISEVEAFALRAVDLKFVASQFRRLHSKQLRHKFRFYSHQWRLWAACFIQAAWRRYNKRKSAVLADYQLIKSSEEDSKKLKAADDDGGGGGAGTSFSVYAKRFGNSIRRGNGKQLGSLVSDSSSVGSLQKPSEPDFSVDED